MRVLVLIMAALLVSLPAPPLHCHAPIVRAQPFLELLDGSTGRVIAAEPLREGEEVVYTWRNSVFGLMVTEILVAKHGGLVLTEVTYADPRGTKPPLARPEDLDDLFQTGGPFRVMGISRPFKSLVFRVGEIGKPKLKIGDKVIEFEREVGFGGTIILTIKAGF